MDEQIIKDFESRLAMFENSVKSIASNFESKLVDLDKQTKDIVENTNYLKKMKVVYENQNKKLLLMESTIDELMYRLENISELSVKKKKRRR